MSNKTKKALGTYFRAFAACVVTALIAIHKSPFEYTTEDFLILANSVWVAFLPVLARAVNVKDDAYGVTSAGKENK